MMKIITITVLFASLQACKIKVKKLENEIFSEINCTSGYKQSGNLCVPIDEPGIIFPANDWEKKSPESQGVNASTLSEAMKYMQENFTGSGNKRTVVIRNGYLIWEGSENSLRQHVYSTTNQTIDA